MNKFYSKRDLRLLVTQKCCYQCLFCHGEGLQSVKTDSLNTSDFGYLFDVSKKNFGIETVTLTGGEPLVRTDIIEIAKCLKNKGAKITLTTNGMLFENNIEIGKYLEKVNISFHVANKKKYEKIVSRKDSYDKAIYGIKLLRKNYPNLKIVLNSACVKGLNYSKQELINLINFAEKINASIKLVELFPPHSPGYVSLNNVGVAITKLGFNKLNTEVRRINYFNGKTNLSLIRIFCAMALESDNPGKFCKQNNDLFVSPDGQIKPCRNNPREINILREIKNRDEKALVDKINQFFIFLGQDCSDFISKDFTKTTG